MNDSARSIYFFSSWRGTTCRACGVPAGIQEPFRFPLCKAEFQSAGGKIAFRFHARDLHLVLGPRADGKPVHFRVTIDGQNPGANHGVDTDAEGSGVVTDLRLYQLVRQKGPIADHTFVIEFQDSGVQAFSFTFG
jgi:hypothetical protein